MQIGQIRKGTKIVIDKDPFVAVEARPQKQSRGSAYMVTKLKNLRTGATLNKTFSPGESVKEADVRMQRGQFLYRAGDKFTFMDNESYENYELDIKVVGSYAQYLAEGADVNLVFFCDALINMELPVNNVFIVVEAPEGVKGDSTNNVLKEVILKTGAKVRVPLFIKEEDQIVVNVETGEYVRRAGESDK